MKKVLLLITAITILSSCDKDDKENNEIPIPKPFPKEEQNRLIKQLEGYWENFEKEIFDRDYVYTENFTKYDQAEYTIDTFVLPRVSRLTEFQLSPGLEIEGHQTIWIDETKSVGYTEFYYITNDTLHIYRNNGIYSWQKGKLDIGKHKVFKHRKDVQIIKEEDINKDLIGKWVNKQGFGSYEFFDDFTARSGGGTISNYEISYGIETHGAVTYRIRRNRGGDMYYNKKENYVLYDHEKYIKQE